ncbi:MAG: hypothetical protein Q9181_003319 [Wetmoreana brouardii]
MEPVTVLGLAASVSQLICVAARSIQYLNDLKVASEDQAKLLQEASNVLPLLIALRNRLEESSSDETWFNGIRSLGVEDGPLDQLYEALEQLATRVQPTSSVKRLGRAVKSPFEKAKCMDILKRIDRTKSMINLALQNDIFKLVQAVKADTARIAGHWLLESLDFSEWISGGKRTLWCTGIPGAGKSVLAAVALDHLQNIFKSSPRVSVAGIYLNYKKEDVQNLENILAGVLAQLLSSHGPLSKTVKEVHQKNTEKGKRPSLGEIISVIKEEIALRDDVYIIIDALDEITESNRAALLAQLDDLSPKLRLMITSRYIEINHDRLMAAARLEIKASDDDLRTYIGQRICDEHRLSKHVAAAAGLKEQIMATVVSKAGGMFLIAKLHMDSMADKASVKSVRKALGNLPVKLEGIYKETYERIGRQPEDLRQLAERTLIWVTYAYRPLSLGIIQHALAVEPGEVDFDEENVPDRDVILNACAGLVVDIFQDSAVRHKRISEKVNHDSSPFYLYGDLNDHPLLRYASHFWGAHAKASPEALIEVQILDFLTRSPSVYLETVGDYDNQHKEPFLQPNPGFSTAAFFGLHESMSRLKPEPKSIDSLGFKNLSALHLAAKNGQHTAVRMLVDWGASIDRPDGWRISTPLSEAIRSFSHSTIKLLLELGADVNKRNRNGETPLIEAVKNGDLESVYILVKSGAEINTQDARGRTPLHRSIGWEPLLRFDSSPETTDSDGPSALHSTELSGDYDSVHSTVERKADLLENRGGRARTPLQRAAKDWRLRSFLYLLPLSNVNTQDCQGETVLHRAVRRGQLELVRLILGFGIDLECRSKIEMTASIDKSAWLCHHSVKKSLWRNFVVYFTNDQSKSGPFQHHCMVFVPSDDSQSLQSLSKDLKGKQVYFWKGSMAALDYANHLGYHAMVQLLEVRTKVRTSGIEIGFDKFFNEHYPERTFDKSQFESANDINDLVDLIRGRIPRMRKILETAI